MRVVISERWSSGTQALMAILLTIVVTSPMWGLFLLHWLVWE